MLSLYNRGLLNNGNFHKIIILRIKLNLPFYAGEYFVIGMDIEQYDTSDPEKYLKGILHSEQEPWVGEAYRSYFAVFPSPTIGFDEFSVKVSGIFGKIYVFYVLV